MGDERTRRETKPAVSDKAEPEYPGSAFLFWGRNVVITKEPGNRVGEGGKRANKNKRGLQ